MGEKLDTFTLEKSNITKNINELKNLLMANIKNLNILYTINKEHTYTFGRFFEILTTPKGGSKLLLILIVE